MGHGSRLREAREATEKSNPQITQMPFSGQERGQKAHLPDLSAGISSSKADRPGINHTTLISSGRQGGLAPRSLALQSFSSYSDNYRGQLALFPSRLRVT